uniref:Capsid protein n=1 Tax=Zosterops erythropleurus Genomoviridae sp. TaxID=2814957 RepID=A0A8E7G1T1_9VIRU|nr:MAG: capsid protein [Gemycircularvirus]
MAYARRKYGSYKARKRTKSSSRRVSYAKRRPYRRTKKISRPMTKKRILNTTSRKKRDEMLPFFQNGKGASGASGPAQFTAATGAVFCWAATARDFTINTSGATGPVSYPAARTATRCYMVGLKETIEIQTSTGLPWQWRRICFTKKGPLGLVAAPELETSYGEQRVLYNYNSGQSADLTDTQTLFGLLFNGTYGVDWTESLIAKTDKNRVTVKFDQTTTVSSGNASGKLFKKSMWMPMRSTLVYDDDESGMVETGSKYSTTGRAGMGDYYVVDIIKAGIGGTSSDQIQFNPCSTLYWHER